MKVDIKGIKDLIVKSPIRNTNIVGNRGKFFNEEIKRAKEIKEIIDTNYENLQRKLNIALVGEVKAGKSTMFNALLGEVVSYMNVVEATANIIEIQYDKVEEIKVIYKNKNEVVVDDITKFNEMLESNRDRQEYFEEIEKIIVYKNLDVLKKLSIVDTPGLETITKENSNRTDDYLKSIDLILFIVNGHHLGQANIFNKVSQLSEYGKPIIAVINRIDEIDSEPEELVEYLDGEVGYMFDRILAISAKEALEGRLNNNSDLYEKSKFDELKSLIEDEIYKNSKDIQIESIENSTKVQLERELSVHGYAFQRLDEIVYGLYQDSIEISKKNEYIINQTVEKFNHWLEYDMLSNERTSILNADNSKQKELFKEYFKESYIKTVIEEQYKELSKFIFIQWQLYNEKIINEKIAGIEGKCISLEQVENIRLGPTKVDNTIDAGINLATTAGTIGLGLAGYSAWFGSAAAYVSIGSALSTFVPPLLIGGLVGGALLGYFKGGVTNYSNVVDKAITNVKEELKKTIYTSVNKEIINMSNHYKLSTINEVNSMLNQFNISIENGLYIREKIISYIEELNIIALKLDLAPYNFNKRFTKYDEEKLIKNINQNIVTDNLYDGKCKEISLINWGEDKSLDGIKKAIRTKVVGVTIGDRQNSVKACRSGQELKLQREPFNEIDKNAIAVLNRNGVKLGYLSKEIAPFLAKKMDDGLKVFCKVIKVTGGGDLNYGLNIFIYDSNTDLALTKEDEINGYHLNDTRSNTEEVDVNCNSKSMESPKEIFNMKLFNENKADEFQKLIFEAANFATAPLLNNVAKYRAGLRATLNRKLEIVNYDESKYIDSLIANVIFYTKVNPNVRSSFQQYLEQNIVLSEQELNQLIFNIQEYFKLPNYTYDSEDNRNKQNCLNIVPVSKRIESLEFDYMYYYTYAEILFELLAYLTNAKNKSILLTKNASNVLTIIEDHVRLYTADVLGTLALSLNK